MHGHSDHLSLVEKIEGNFQMSCLLRILSSYYDFYFFLTLLTGLFSCNNLSPDK